MNNLKKIRLEQQLSQANLANKSGINIRCIQDYEQNRRELEVAEVQRVYDIAKALNTRIETLIGKELL